MRIVHVFSIMMLVSISSAQAMLRRSGRVEGLRRLATQSAVRRAQEPERLRVSEDERKKWEAYFDEWKADYSDEEIRNALIGLRGVAQSALQRAAERLPDSEYNGTRVNRVTGEYLSGSYQFATKIARDGVDKVRKMEPDDLSADVKNEKTFEAAAARERMLKRHESEMKELKRSLIRRNVSERLYRFSAWFLAHAGGATMGNAIVYGSFVDAQMGVVAFSSGVGMAATAVACVIRADCLKVR